MKDPYQVLEQKKMEIERVKEIEALHFVIPLLAEDADLIERRSLERSRRMGTSNPTHAFP